jgi:hypothetical protein
MKVTNIAPGPRGLRSFDGDLVMLEPGASETIRLAKGELADARETGWFSFGEDGALDHDGDGEPGGVADPSPLTDAEEAELIDAMSDDELRDFIERKTGTRPHPNAKSATLVEKAKAAAQG